MSTWCETVGLANGQRTSGGGARYMTAETFGHKINCNGAALKKKQQLWSIVSHPLDNSTTAGVGDDEHVALRSHLGCYLAADSFGNVTCDTRELTPGARFTITICAMTDDDGGE